MWWFRKNTERRFLRLLDRYLDPHRTWSVDHDREMRHNMAETQRLRIVYDRAIIAHRLMLGLSVDTASALENERMHQIVVHSLAASTNNSRYRMAGWVAAFGAAGVAAMLVVVLVPQESAQSHSPAADEYIGVRSGENPARSVTHLGLVGVTEDGREYEIEANGYAYVNDYARLSYKSSAEALRNLFVFGLQPASEPLWYYPLPDEGQSLRIEAGEDAASQDLPDETLLSKRHTPGSWYVVGVFSEAPIVWEDAQRALTSPGFSVSEFTTVTEIVELVRSRLRLGVHDRVEVVSMEIRGGSYPHPLPQ